MATVQWCAVAVILVVGCCAALDNDLGAGTGTGTGTDSNDNHILKQVVWKRCYRKLTPACLKFSLIRTVEMISKDSTFTLLPGVYFSSNTSGSSPLPPEFARSLSLEQAPLDDLVAFTLGKYLRSLSVNVNLVDFISGGNETLQNSVIDVFSGRGKKDGLGSYGAIAAMMGGMMASMMMAALAALAGKALMTSLLALMMAAFAAMKGGGGGDHETKHYEVITKPVVSHINTHSSEVQHEHHGHYHKRSVGADPWSQGKPNHDTKTYSDYQPTTFKRDVVSFDEPRSVSATVANEKRLKMAGNPPLDYRKDSASPDEYLTMALRLLS